MKYLKPIIAIIIIGIFSIICFLTAHVFHFLILPAMLSVAAWGGMNFHKCKCLHKDCKEHYSRKGNNKV